MAEKINQRINSMRIPQADKNAMQAIFNSLVDDLTTLRTQHNALLAKLDTANVASANNAAQVSVGTLSTSKT